MVTNGDWAAEDKWHHNKGVDLAAERLTKANIPFRIPGKDEVTDESIVPVGRGEFQSAFYSFMGTFCGKPDRKYSFLIDEMGEIFKCGMGVWDYDNINHFLEGGFDDRFVEFNKKFYSIFIANCGSCERAFKHSLREEKKAQNKSLPIVKE